MGLSLYIAIPLLLLSYYYLSKEGRTREERLRGRDRLRLINRLGFFNEPGQTNQNDFNTSSHKKL